MIQQFLPTLVAALALSAIVVAPNESRATSIRDLNYLVGTWNCTQGHQRYTETWAYVVGGAYLRGTDKGAGMPAAEHTITVASDGTVSGVDLFTGGMEVMHGTGSSLQAKLHAVFPPHMSTRVVFNRMAPARYTVDVSGSDRGKPFKEHNVCTKA